MTVRVRPVATALLALGAVLASCSGDATPAPTAPDATVAPAPNPAPTPAPTMPTGSTEPAPNRPFEVVTLDAEVVDAARDRRIPYRVYAPAGLPGAAPIILVSHGGTGNALGSRTGQHLGRTFAAGGYLAVHVGHLPSRPGTQHRIDRPADVSHLLDRLADGTLPLPAGFPGQPDLARVGHTGHSFGAYTAHALAGATFDRTFTDERVLAIAPISPQGPGQFRAFDRGPQDNTWRTVTVPVYGLVGGDELDSNAVDSIVRPGWRLIPSQRYPGTADTFLTVIDGLDHRDMWSTGTPDVEAFVATQIMRFFDVYVRGDPVVDACSIGEGSLPGASTQRRAASSGSRLAACS